MAIGIRHVEESLKKRETGKRAAILKGLGRGNI